MKPIFFLFLVAAVALTACRRDRTWEPAVQSGVTLVNQKLVEFKTAKGNTPTIVYISGFDTKMENWDQVINRTPFGQAYFTYNRPGVGQSENVPGTRDAVTIAAEMKKVLEAGKAKAPYVLVAHSMGGIYARMFYHMYPQLVKAIVLVDASHERTMDSLLSFIPMPDRQLLAAYLQHINDSTLQTYPSGSVKEEFRANFQLNYNQIMEKPAITKIPVYVLSSVKVAPGQNPLAVDIAAALRNEWALAAGNKGKHVMTDKSGHFIQMEEPYLVAEGIHWVLTH